MSDQYNFCRRLGSSHKDLAVCLEIATNERESWPKGEEPNKILEWLKNRLKLQQLEPALKKIEREDLVDLAQSLCKIHNSVNISVEENNQESKVAELDGTNCFISESSHEDFAVDLKNADLVPSSELNPDLQSQESMPPEENVEAVEEEYADTPIEKMRETEDGKPTLFALWEIALKSDLNEEFVDAEPEDFLIKMYHQSPQAKSGLTKIQNELWDVCCNKEAEILKQPFHSNLNVVISAPTSSGKSTLAEIFLAIPSFRYQRRKCAIYIAPTRALTQAKYRDLQTLFKGDENQLSQLVLSTGEDIRDDWKINSGRFSIACMVYEKANILFSQSPKLLESLGCIVVDEMHMIADLERGPILEMALTKALDYQSKSDTATKHSSSNKAMRVVLISTEEKPKPEIEKFLAVLQQNGKWEDSLCFSDDYREVSVEHRLVLAAKEKENREKGSYVDFLITDFQNNQQRQLSVQEINFIDRGLFKISRELLAQGNLQRKSSEEFDKRLIKLIIDLLLKQPKGYRILVFVPGRQDAEQRAAQLKNQLQSYTSKEDKSDFLGNNERHKKLAEKFKELLKNAEDTRMAKTLERCIEFGIFIHHSDIERKIRTEIEETCSVVSPDMPSQVIFATETLSYGINLAVQDVILHGVEFYSQDRFGEFRSELLSTSSYHNMIGRAGRKGKGDSGKAHAYILVPQDSRPKDIVRDYYTEIAPVDSKLYVIDDKQVQYNAEGRLNIPNSGQPENGCAKYASLGASDFSYPFARSILDALRHLNIGKKEDSRNKTLKGTLLKFLDGTLYKRTTDSSLKKPEDQKREDNLFHCAIERILDDCSSDQLELVTKTTGEGKTCYYEITPLGESIIDTGTEISTVGQLRKIVNSIHSIWDEYYGSRDRDFPMELYLLCIVAQKEVFREYIRCTPECKTKTDRRKWSEDIAKENRLRVDSRLKEYLIKLPQMKKLSDEQSTELIEKLRGQILNPWDALRRTEENYEFGASDTILRLFSGILAWIDETDRDDVYKLIEGRELGESMKGTMQRLGHFTEVLSYKILFLSKMLEKLRLSRSNPSIIDAEIESERELRILASRLRFGCTSKAVSFFKPSSSNINRKQAKDMLNLGITPRWMLIANLDDPYLLKKSGISSDKLELLKQDIERDARGSFERLAEDLTSGINEDEPKRRLIKDLVKEMPKLFNNSVESFTTSINSLTNFDDLLRQELKRLEGATLVADSAGKEARLNLYQVQINIPPEQIGIEWSGQKAATTPSEKESDEERELQYIEQDRIKIVGIQFNHRWDCQINQIDRNFIQFLNQHEDTKHIAIVPLPWIPSPNELNDNIKTCLHNRIKDGKTTTFITPAAFAAMLVFIVRKFDNLEYYTEDLTKLLVRSGSSSSNFNVVTVEDVRRVMRHRETDVPSSIMQALLEHFEADGDV